MKYHFIGMSIKQNVRIKIQQINEDISSDQTLLKSIDYLFLVYTNETNNAKRFNEQKYYVPKDIIKNYNVIINGKHFMINQLIQI